MHTHTHTHREEKAKLYKYLDLVQRSSHVMRDLAPIAQEVLAPFAELTPIMFWLVLLVPAAELGCKSWLPQGYSHELLPSGHPASQNRSAVAVNRSKPLTSSVLPSSVARLQCYCPVLRCGLSAAASMAQPWQIACYKLN